MSWDWLPGQYLVADVWDCFAGENKQADPVIAQRDNRARKGPKRYGSDLERQPSGQDDASHVLNVSPSPPLHKNI